MIIFPDTNLFIHFRDLRELEWSDVTSDPTVTLIAGRTVQKELQKKRHELRGRSQDRARRYAKALGDIVVAGAPELLRDAGPRLVLDYVARPVGWTAPRDLAEGWGDDQLVADALAYRVQHPDASIAVLSDDAEVMAVAHAHNIAVLRPPTRWELPTEATTEQREIARLTREVSDLKRRGPAVDCALTHADAEIKNFLSLIITRRDALTETEIETVLARPTAARPLATQFDTPHGSDPDAYDPPSEKTIAAYTGAYERWRAELRAEIERRGQRSKIAVARVSLTLTVQNLGVEPAENMRVVIQASDGLKLYEPTETAPPPLEPAAFRDPPRPPRPTRKRVPGQGFDLSELEGLEDYEDPSARRRSAFEQVIAQSHTMRDLDSLSRHTLMPIRPISAEPRDPQAFYRRMPHENRKGGSYWDYECESFPHLADPEPFEFDVVAMLAEDGPITGEIGVRVTANNLRTPVEATLRLRLDVRRDDAVAEIARLLDLEPSGS